MGWGGCCPLLLAKRNQQHTSRYIHTHIVCMQAEENQPRSAEHKCKNPEATRWAGLWCRPDSLQLTVQGGANSKFEMMYWLIGSVWETLSLMVKRLQARFTTWCCYFKRWYIILMQQFFAITKYVILWRDSIPICCYLMLNMIYKLFL